MYNKLICLIFSIITISAFSQNNITNYGTYKIAGIVVEGNQNLDHKTIIKFSKLKIGDNIDLDNNYLGDYIKNLWQQNLFSKIDIVQIKKENELIFLKIIVKENPKLSKFNFYGIKKSEEDQLRELLKLSKGQVISNNKLDIIKKQIITFLQDKGFYYTIIEIIDNLDEDNYMSLSIKIDKNEKIKIKSIKFTGNNFITEKQLKRTMKNTKENNFFRIFKSSKILDYNLKEDLKLIQNKYFENGFMDFKISSDSIFRNEDNTISVLINLEEGGQYFFGRIKFIGNTIYNNKQLKKIVNFKENEVFNKTILDQKLFGSPDGNDVHSLYLDNGYLFSQINTQEVLNEIDKIDVFIYINEGKQAKVNEVKIIGNTKTNDNVILREIKTKPGDLFNRSLVMRSQREIAQLNYFENEKLDVDIKPNNDDGNVDINYIVEEKHTDQIELQGGWGGGRLIGTFGVSFNNFSAKNVFNKSAWTPIPSGDGQRVSIRASSNGSYFQSYSLSFTEPWLGGKKPNSLSSSIWSSTQTNGLERDDPNREVIKITGLQIGLGKRLKWPDDFFTLSQNLSLENFNLTNSTSSFTLSDGLSYNYSYNIVIGRNSIDQPTFPRKGSNISLSLQLTPPYSLINPKDNIEELTDEEKFKWVEYHKWKFGANWFNSFSEKLVLKTNLEYGLIGMYNKKLGLSPFERFYVGGDGLYGYNLDGRDIISLRGYENGSLTPITGATIYNKYTLELRYGISLSGQSPIYILSFLEAGNAWEDFQEFNPFIIKRSAGVGIRIGIPMMGIMGVDWGYGFDNIPGQPTANKGQFHFSINQMF